MVVLGLAEVRSQSEEVQGVHKILNFLLKMFSELLLELWCWTCHLVDRHMKSGVLTLTPRENRESSEYILKSSKNTIFNEHHPALMQIILLAYCVSQQIENRDFWIVSCNCKTAENKKIKLSHVKR